MSASDVDSDETYASTFGRTYEFMHAVNVRSYSRNSGSTSEEIVTGKSGWGPIRVEQGVRGLCRAVHDVTQLLRRNAALVADAPQGDEHALRGVAGRRRRLRPVQAARFVADEEQVGEGAAHVHSEPVRH